MSIFCINTKTINWCMSSPREVLIRILSAITKEDVNWNKKSHFKMLKTALFDSAINEKCCSVDWGRGICPLFSSPPRGIWQLKSPQPLEFAIQGKKTLMPLLKPCYMRTLINLSNAIHFHMHQSIPAAPSPPTRGWPPKSMFLPWMANSRGRGLLSCCQIPRDGNEKRGQLPCPPSIP